MAKNATPTPDATEVSETSSTWIRSPKAMLEQVINEPVLDPLERLQAVFKVKTSIEKALDRAIKDVKFYKHALDEVLPGLAAAAATDLSKGGK